MSEKIERIIINFTEDEEYNDYNEQYEEEFKDAINNKYTMFPSKL